MLIEITQIARWCKIINGVIQFIALLNLEWEPSNLSVWGPLLCKMRHRVVWTYGVPPDPYALIRITNLNGNHGY